jgi:hypothetical protein
MMRNWTPDEEAEPHCAPECPSRVERAWRTCVSTRHRLLHIALANPIRRNRIVAMARKIFFSFHYKPDNWRVSQVRNIGAIEGNKPASDNDWESVTGGGDAAIEKWIADQMSGRSCSVVMIGAGTAGRKWINYEIVKTWNDGKGIFGIHIHNLKDSDGKQSARGSNPFTGVTIKNGQTKLSDVVKVYEPPYTTSTDVYDYIKTNIESWIEAAIKIRSEN